jgi:hypothetical protein
MRRPFLPEAVLLFFVILLLMVPSLQAGEPGPIRPARSASIDSSPWDFLIRAWGFLTAAWSENGCEFDPDGRCLPQQGTTTIDNGCEADPSGRCLATVNNGCEFDPNGRCLPQQLTVDNGCEADPDGRCRG